MTDSVESPSSFQDSENVAWQYFHNAFSVHTELLYHNSNLTAIQARPCPISLSSLSQASLPFPYELPLISYKIKIEI
jgi:hypothetical protein